MPQLFIRDGAGKKRKAVKRLCQNCDNEFLFPERFVKEGRGKYCSRACIGESRKTEVTLECAKCEKSFERRKSKIKNSSSGLFFCSRECKDSAQKLGAKGITAIMPPHYGTAKTGNQKYRRLFESHEFVCRRCGYDEFESSVDIHHIDENRLNDDKNNLMPLCKCCHQALHDGYWKLKEEGRDTDGRRTQTAF